MIFPQRITLVTKKRNSTTRQIMLPARGCRSSFNYNGTHRDLHSFPTRRSSDLAAIEGRIEHRPVLELACVMHPDQLENRSEEHTSELQSRENLVCRLLLEKKKDGRACCVAGCENCTLYRARKVAEAAARGACAR